MPVAKIFLEWEDAMNSIASVCEGDIPADIFSYVLKKPQFINIYLYTFFSSEVLLKCIYKFLGVLFIRKLGRVTPFSFSKYFACFILNIKAVHQNIKLEQITTW